MSEIGLILDQKRAYFNISCRSELKENLVLENFRKSKF